ncbi:MauE/DoxX family redox-associated membrane protein [Verrucomicrobium spinosum]|uniref:MauE/DoxX family redox-associated membrane protein n=1 Tax=Verrucomicrobium spinosum TaxID=2736 RepID=UPI00017443FF|nr:MauE/DoxX family redox-associated membrane protein [Verrucomicrobium spinosum]
MEERRQLTWQIWLTRVLAWGFGGLFVWAGWLKVQDPTLFLISVRSFRMLPDPFAAWLALGLPWLEIFAGLAVVTGVFRRGGLLLLNLLLVAFGIALVTALVRGLDVECGCFGGKNGTTHIWEVLARDGVLLAVGLWLGRRGRS